MLLSTYRVPPQTHPPLNSIFLIRPSSFIFYRSSASYYFLFGTWFCPNVQRVGRVSMQKDDSRSYFGAREFTIFSNRGSPRSGLHTGSNFKLPSFMYLTIDARCYPNY